MSPFRFFYLLAITFSTLLYSKEIEIQGHRGNRGMMPENTLTGFASGLEVGANVLELDLHMTKDGQIVIHHDYYIHSDLGDDGIPLPGPICSLLLSEVKSFDCGSNPNPDFPEQTSLPGAQIPTLQELFDMLNASSHPRAQTIRLNLELKRDPRRPELSAAPNGLAEKVIALVRANGFENRVCYSSFDPAMLFAVRSQDSEARISLIYNEETLSVLEKMAPGNEIAFLLNIARNLKAETLSPHDTLLKNADDVAAFHEAGFRVVAWTVNDELRGKELIEMGVDGLITDYPARFVQSPLL